jgi:Tfp pilus assembly protein PilO
MDINTYQKAREAELKAFRKEYNDLKRQYNQLLSQAVYETEPTKQAELVKQILTTNSELAKHVREFIQGSRDRFDPKMISELTADIIRYQQDYEAIQHSSDKSKALNEILNKEKIELKSVHEQFNWWIGFLLGGIVIVLLLIFRTSLKQATQARDALRPSTSTIGMGELSGV